MDGLESVEGKACPLTNTPPHPLQRKRIDEVLQVGVKVGGRNAYLWNWSKIRYICWKWCGKEYTSGYDIKKFQSGH